MQDTIEVMCLDTHVEYQLIRSKRKSISLQVDREAKVIVRAPRWVPKWQIEAFVSSKTDWINKHIEIAKERLDVEDERRVMSPEEYSRIKRRAQMAIPIRVDYWAEFVGVSYNRISIRNQKTRWGSCSIDGNLNFHMMLVTMPDEIRDYVIIHELCHRKHMNHSTEFWNEVSKYDPEFKLHRKWLREHGAEYQVEVK